MAFSVLSNHQYFVIPYRPPLLPERLDPDELPELLLPDELLLDEREGVLTLPDELEEREGALKVFPEEELDEGLEGVLYCAGGELERLG